MNHLEEIKKEIEKIQYEYISFDIFDTLIVRDVWEPTDLFILLDEEFKRIFNNSKIKRFSKIRVECEEEARIANIKRNNGHEDINLDEIYELIQKKYRLDYITIMKLKELEIELERQHCYCRESVKELYEYSIEYGKKVICISDMYLPTPIITSLLEKNGYNRISKIYVSSDVKLTKYSGGLYEHVVNSLNITKEQLLHIGDNLYSDKIKAEKAGIRAVYYPKTKEIYRQILMSKKLDINNMFLYLWYYSKPSYKYLQMRMEITAEINTKCDNASVCISTDTCDFVDSIVLIIRKYNKLYYLKSIGILIYLLTRKIEKFNKKLIKLFRYYF